MVATLIAFALQLYALPYGFLYFYIAKLSRPCSHFIPADLLQGARQVKSPRTKFLTGDGPE